MVVVPRSIIWSPHKGQNQFLAGGTELKLYEWVPETHDSLGRARYISTIPDITLMMCADWSPDPNCSDLVAVGLTTGRTLLVRMQEHSLTDYPNSDGIDTPTQGKATIYSNSENSSSSSNLIRQQQQQQHQQQHQQQQKQYPSLGVKLSRSSNVVSFSKTHPHLLAAGLDKVRNDPCLLVWDVTRSIDSYCNTPTGAQTPTATFGGGGGGGGGGGVTRGHSQHESRSTIANQWRIDNRDNFDIDRPRSSDMPPISTPGSSSRDQGPVRQYGSSEAISSCAWSEHANAPLLVAGMGNKYLRVYDVRADASSSPLQFATKAVHGIVVDPFSSYRVASYTEEGIIKLWDIRKNNDAILTLNAENKNSLSKIVFSQTQPGFLASLTKDATHIDLWDIQETCSLQSAVNSSVQKSSTASTSTQLPQHSQQTSALQKLERSASHTALQTLAASHGDEDELSIPVLWKSRKTRSSVKKFASFTFIPYSLSPSKSVSDNILAIHTDGKFESVKVQEACQISWQPSGGMVMTGKKGLLSYLPAFVDSKLDKKLASVQLDDGNNATEDADQAIYQSDTREQLLPRQTTITMCRDTALAAELDKDISVVMRKRVLQGYSMDAAKNFGIVTKDRKLREVWTWMKFADQISSKLSKIGNVDYSFHGVYGIWTGHQGRNGKSSSPASSSPRNGSSLSKTPRPSSSPAKSRENDGASPLTDKLNDMSNYLPMVDTAKSAQRNVALSACGFGFDAKGFERLLVDLESRGEYDKAAGLALFYGAPKRAIKALSSARGRDQKEEQQRKLVSAILASYQAGGTNTNDTWKDICESLSSDMAERPYLRAIFAYIASNDWYRILDEPGLPLRERMAIALRVLSDDDMSVYLNRTLDKLVQEGDVEGIVVTGLTHIGVDLLEKALDIYGDVQTVSLIMSYVVPKRFKDSRVDDWVET
ncbi:WD40-repeat-containing domain protein [Parasitella parasitica]|nr:WD40-repeat-containing domain protein [Parasitella parasitica]